MIQNAVNITSRIRGKFKKIMLLTCVALAAAATLNLFGFTTTIPQSVQDVNVNVDAGGNVSATYPIALPPAAKDLLPPVALTYAGGGSGLAGNWDLIANQYIYRNPAKGIHFNSSDAYASSMGGELVKLGGYYYSKKDRHLRFRAHGVDATGPDYWTITDKNGLVYTFGDPTRPDSRLTALGVSSAQKVWGLTRVEDPFGNYYELTYRTDSEQMGVLYPERIVYNRGNTVIEFGYESRTDYSQTYSLSGRTEMRLRLAEITVRLQGAVTEQFQLDYDYSPATGLSRLQTINRNGYDPLVLNYTNYVQTAGNLEAPGNTLRRPMDLNYISYFEGQAVECETGRYFCAMTMVDAAHALIFTAPCNEYIYNFGNRCEAGIENSLTFFSDVTGNGVPEFIKVNGGLNGTTTLNNTLNVTEITDTGIQDGVNHGNFDRFIDLPTQITDIDKSTYAPKRLIFSANTVVLNGDIDGDLKNEVIILEDPNLVPAISAPLGGTGVDKEAQGRFLKWEGGKLSTPKDLPGFVPKFPTRPPEDNRTYHFAADTTGDGKPELLQFNGTDLELYRNDTYYNPVHDRTEYQFTRNGNYAFTGPFGTSSQIFADFNNDSKADFLRVEERSGTSGSVYVSITDKNILSRTDLADVGHSRNRYVADVNNDRFPDLIIVQDSQLRVHYWNGKNFANVQNIPVNNITAPADVEDLYPRGAQNHIHLVDINGDNYDDRITSKFEFGHLMLRTVELWNPAINNYDPIVTGPILVPEFTLDLSGDGYPDRLYLDFGGGNPRLRIEICFDPADPANAGRQPVAKADVERIRYVNLDISELLTFDPPHTAKVATATDAKYNTFRHGIIFADYDNDGRTDLIRHHGDRIYISYGKFDNGRLFYNPDGDLNFAADGLVAALDSNGDGRLDLAALKADKDLLQYDIPFQTGRSYRDNYAGHVNSGELVVYRGAKLPPSDMLTDITGMNGKSLRIGYASIQDKAALPDAVKISLTSLNDPKKPNRSSLYVVTSLELFPGDGSVLKETLNYKNALIQVEGLDDTRSLGFETVIRTNTLTGERVEADYYQTTELAGLPRETRNYGLDGKIKTKGTNQYTFQVNSHGSEEIRPSISETIRYDQNENPLVTVRSEVTRDSAGTWEQVRKTTNGGHVELIKTSYLQDDVNWILERVTAVESSINGKQTQHQKFLYNGNVLEETQSYNGTAWTSTYLEDYDTFGNPRRLRNHLSHTTLLEYDTVIGKYPVKVTNALGHPTVFTYDYKYGKKLTERGPNGDEKAWKYDAYGRIEETREAGECCWTRRYIYNNTGHPLNEEVKVQVRDSHNNSAIEERRYTDAMGRTIRKESDTYDGKVRVETFQYDSLGRLKYKSLPYVAGVETPLNTEYLYDAGGRLVQTISPDGNFIRMATSGFISETTHHSSSGTLLATRIETRDPLGRLIRLVEQGRAIDYEYTDNGKLSKVTAPGNMVTLTEYDYLGRKIRVTAPTGAKTETTYDVLGRLNYTKDARGVEIRQEHDILGRVTRRYTSGGENIVFQYDDPGINYSYGRLSRVNDSSGSTEFEYTAAGRLKRKTITVDGVEYLFDREYDSMGRVTTLVYPDGTKANYHYNGPGFLNGVTMDSHDGTSTAHALVGYSAPSSGAKIVTRTSGNGVKTDIAYDPIHSRVVEATTKLKNGVTAQHKLYAYDARGNITGIEDKKNAADSQTFAYDDINRLTAATGIYGTANYTYSAGGNLLTKGDLVYTYGHATNKQALTSVYSNKTGTIAYQYDALGNAVERGGDTLTYNDFGKMVSMDNASSGVYDYTYNFKGQRVKKKHNAAQWSETVILDNLYEVSGTAGKPSTHTVYFYGMKQDLISHATRENVVLRIASVNHGLLAAFAGFLGLNACATVGVGCSEYLSNRFSDILSKNKLSVYLGLALALLAGLYCLMLLTWRSAQRGDASLYGRGRGRLALSTPLLLVSLISLFGFQGCDLFTPGGSGPEPWLLFPSGISNISTPSVGGAGGGGGAPGVNSQVVTGMYFYHPDHLGSTTMLTDGYGALVSGAIAAGFSRIIYKPYGDIDRVNSEGPDITRFKYSGQIEERESGLHFYKSRYYDPLIGRFIQADSLIISGHIQGSNQYMYVNGNPMRYTDPGGTNAHVHMFNQIFRHMMGGTRHISKGLGRISRAISKPWTNALVDANKLIYGKHHNQKSLTHGRAFLRSAARGLQIGLAFSNPMLSMLIDPAFTLGAYLSALNMFVGTVAHIVSFGGISAPFIKYQEGAYITKNAPLSGHGIALGPFVNVPAGATAATIRHELAHVDQWREWGGHKYLGHTITSPLQAFGASNAGWAENNADQRAGTGHYGNNEYFTKQVEMIKRQMGIQVNLNDNRSKRMTNYYLDSGISEWFQKHGVLLPITSL